MTAKAKTAPSGGSSTRKGKTRSTTKSSKTATPIVVEEASPEVAIAPTPEQMAKAVAEFLTELPSLPHLLLCHVAVLDNRVAEIAKRLGFTPEQVKQYADVYAVLGANNGHCFACAKPLIPGESCACIDALRKGYREHIPGCWDRIPEIVAGVKAGTIDRGQVVYSDTCKTQGCTERVRIYAGDFAAKAEKFGVPARSTRCKTHGLAQRARADARRQHSNAAKPAAPRQGLATIGEQMAAKGTESAGG